MSHRPFLGSSLYGQINQLDQGLLIGEAGFVLGYFPNLPVQALNGIGGVDKRPDLRWIFEKSRDLGPVLFLAD